MHCTKSTNCLQSENYLISNLEHSHLIDYTRQLHRGALCAGIYKWAQSVLDNKGAKSIAVSEAVFFQCTYYIIAFSGLFECGIAK